MKRIIVLLVACFCFSGLFSQALDFNSKIPVDSAIIIGKLKNGITYYIRKNQKPEQRMDIRIAVKAGSVLENDDQLGLAHFTEHMAFNGTKNFAKNELVSYLQSLGVRFGADLNAYTGFDETVYLLTLPTDKKDVVEKGFDVLKDWSQNITFDSTEVEKERGVVLEEWRLGQGADQRMRDKYFPVIFHDSKYASRLPIGTKESLLNFKHESIKQFYKTWYRPDLMAVIAVGDFDVKEVEKMIKEHFEDIPVVPNAKKREEFEVPNHRETLVSVTSDKEATYSSVIIYHKVDPKPEVTLGDFRAYALNQLITGMINQRLAERTRSAEPPFVSAFSQYGNLIRAKDCYITGAMVMDTGIITGLKALLTENNKIQKHGFTQGELERIKMDVLSSYEQVYNERDKTESESYASEYTRNFLSDEPIPGIAFEYHFMKTYLPQVTLDDVNSLVKVWLSDSNQVVVVTAPEKDGLKLPDEKEIKLCIEQSHSEEVAAYTDKLAGAVLMDKLPVPGKITKQESIDAIGVTKLTLSNGAKVVLKPTDFKNDEILLSAISPGGESLYPDSDNYTANFATVLVHECGVGNYSLTDLQKLLAGKTVSVSPDINMYNETMKASSTPKDVETMFQLLHLYFTQPHKDLESVKSTITRYKAYFKNIESNPQIYYKDQYLRTLSQNHVRGGGIPKESDLDRVNINRIFDIYKERYSNAGDFIFVITGSFTKEAINPLIEKYIASLPGTKQNEKYRDLGIRPPSGVVNKDVYKGADAKSIATVVYAGNAKYSSDEAYKLVSFADYLEIRLIEVLREEKSGVYGLGASASMGRVPYESYSVKIQFPCGPENVDSLLAAANEIINEVKQKGISDDYLKKIKETQLRELEVNLKKNDYWLSYLENVVFYNDDILAIQKKKERIEALKADDFKEMANKYVGNNVIKVILYPENMKK